MPFYIAMLDSEKAYDSVWRDGIFFKLMRKIDAQFWISLKDFYSKSDGIFKINGIIDESVVNINRGVKQGGVLSPKLFNYFINSHVCCFGSSILINSFGYDFRGLNKKFKIKFAMPSNINFSENTQNSVIEQFKNLEKKKKK